MQGAALAPRYTVGIKDPAEGFLHETRALQQGLYVFTIS
jgi:hypothetical protein